MTAKAATEGVAVVIDDGRRPLHDREPVRVRILSRSDILGADDLARETVDTPEWGGSVIVRCLTGAERNAIAIALSDGGAEKLPVVFEMKMRFLAASIINEAGEHLFTVDDLAALNEKNPMVMDRIFVRASRLSGWSAVDVAALAVSLGNAQSAASGSG